MLLFKNYLVYFIQGKTTKRIKIGRTQQYVDERIRSLQTGSPDELIFLGGILGHFGLEHKIQEQFQSFRLHGEWFEPANEILDFIQTSCLKDPIVLHRVDLDMFNHQTKFDDAVRLGNNFILEQIENENMEVFKQMWAQQKEWYKESGTE